LAAEAWLSGEGRLSPKPGRSRHGLAARLLPEARIAGSHVSGHPAGAGAVLTEIVDEFPLVVLVAIVINLDALLFDLAGHAGDAPHTDLRPCGAGATCNRSRHWPGAREQIADHIGRLVTARHVGVRAGGPKRHRIRLLGLAIGCSARLLPVGVERIPRHTGKCRYRRLRHARLRRRSRPRLARDLLIRITGRVGAGLAHIACGAGGEISARLRLPAFARTTLRHARRALAVAGG
jgi:hypothetical protein